MEGKGLVMGYADGVENQTEDWSDIRKKICKNIDLNKEALECMLEMIKVTQFLFIQIEELQSQLSPLLKKEGANNVNFN